MKSKTKNIIITKMFPNDYDLGEYISLNKINGVLIKLFPNYRELGYNFRKIVIGDDIK